MRQFAKITRNRQQLREIQNSCDFDRRKSTNPDLSHMLIMRQSAEINSDNLNIANAFTSRDS
jgi:hypothetical protein